MRSRAGRCGVLLALLVACAPRADSLKGDAADAVRKGIVSGTGTMDHQLFDRVLYAHTRELGTRFDYAGLARDPTDLDGYLRQVARANLARLGRDELLALLINAYNALVIRSVLDTITPDRPEGVASIRDIPEVFRRPDHVVGGFRLSLDNLELNLIRPLFRDPRIHFAVNCASVSCPPLPDEALTGAHLDSQLEHAARRTLSSPDYVRVEAGRLRVTRILDWFGSDFVSEGYRGAEKSLPAYLRKYASAEVAAWLDSTQPSPPPVRFLDYDWSLNRATRIRLQDGDLP